MVVTGEDILNVLKNQKSPVTITEIMAQLSSKDKGSKTDLTETAKVLTEAGVWFGCIVEEENKFRSKEQIKENAANKDKSIETLETVNSHNEMSSSNNRTEKAEKMEVKTTKEIKHQNYSREADEEDENDINDTVDCYGPTSRRKRSRSRSRKRSQSGKRLSRRRQRRYQ